MFLTTLRYLLVQDWDLDGDGRAETLRLLYAAPGRWLRDGAVLRVERAPSMFGDVTFRVESRLEKGEVLLTLNPLPRRPEKLLVRPALPSGWKVVAARNQDTDLSVEKDGSVAINSADREITVRFRVARNGG